MFLTPSLSIVALGTFHTLQLKLNEEPGGEPEGAAKDKPSDEAQREETVTIVSKVLLTPLRRSNSFAGVLRVFIG